MSDNNEYIILEVNQLSISYFEGKKEIQTVKAVSFSIKSKEIVVLVGESGSGKSTISQAIIGLLPNNGRITAGSIRLNGETISSWSAKRCQGIRGQVISLIPQDPVSSFDPIKTVGQQMTEVFQIHTKKSKREIKKLVLELFEKVDLSHPELRFNQYPHELSGGMRQRVLIAMAIALKPQLIIADEPTSALDVTVQKQILELINTLRNEFNTAVLLVTHDLGIAANYGDKIIVLKQGELQEQGDIATILHNPQHPYTQQLIDNIPCIHKTKPQQRVNIHNQKVILSVEHLSRSFRVKVNGNIEPFKAVDDISFSISAGTTHAIVGESGSGKTTTIKMILGIQKPEKGHIFIDGVDLTTLKGEALRQIRKKIQLVQQNPFTSLDPKYTIYKIIEEPLLNYEPIAKVERQKRVRSMLEKVNLPEKVLHQKPAHLSGGQRQRVAIARALILMPQILVLDEAVSALDVTVQDQILMLLGQLQQEFGLTYLFISHDLAVVKQISDTVSVMKNGQIVEENDINTVFNSPKNAYTQTLIASIPIIKK